MVQNIASWEKLLLGISAKENEKMINNMKNI